MSDLLAYGPIGVAAFLIMLGFVVVIHELGHYLAGRVFGAAAESFSVGFGKPIFERKDKRNTRWRINWIPFGGFVKFVGESQLAGDVNARDAGQMALNTDDAHGANAPIGKKYMDLTVGQRSIVSAAGPFANFVLAAFLFAIVAMNFGKPVEQVGVAGFGEGPAQAAGFEIGDKLISANGAPIKQRADVQRIVSLATGDVLRFVVDRNGQQLDIEVVPIRGQRDNGFGQIVSVGQVGLVMNRVKVDHVRFGLTGSLMEGVRQTGEVMLTTGKMLKRLVTGREPISQLSGPVGIGDMTQRVVTSTLGQEQVPLFARLKAVGWTLLQITAFVSVGIGIVNLLPFPVLDGGHLVFNAYEAITGSVLPAKIQEVTLTFGAIFLLGMAVIITASDIVKTGILQGFSG